MLADSYEYETEQGEVYRFETPEAAFEVKTLATQILENKGTSALDILNPSEPAIVRTNDDQLKVTDGYDSAPEAVEQAAAVLQGEDDFEELGEWYDE